MTYFDCYLIPVLLENRAAYETLANLSAKILEEYGALRVVECWLDETGPEASSYHEETARRESENYGTFMEAAGAKDGETTVMSLVEWPDKAARDQGMEKLTSDPRMRFDGTPPTFEGSRLIAAGFRPMLDSKHGA